MQHELTQEDKQLCWCGHRYWEHQRFSCKEHEPTLATLIGCLECEKKEKPPFHNPWHKAEPSIPQHLKDGNRENHFLKHPAFPLVNQ